MKMTQYIQCLLCKYEDPSLSPRIHVRKDEHGAYPCNPSARYAENWTSHWPASLAFSIGSRLMRDKVSKNKGGGALEPWFLGLTSGLHMHMHPHKHAAPLHAHRSILISKTLAKDFPSHALYHAQHLQDILSLDIVTRCTVSHNT